MQGFNYDITKGLKDSGTTKGLKDSGTTTTVGTESDNFGNAYDNTFMFDIKNVIMDNIINDNNPTPNNPKPNHARTPSVGLGVDPNHNQVKPDKDKVKKPKKVGRATTVFTDKIYVDSRGVVRGQKYYYDEFGNKAEVTNVDDPTVEGTTTGTDYAVGTNTRPTNVQVLPLARTGVVNTGVNTEAKALFLKNEMDKLKHLAKEVHEKTIKDIDIASKLGIKPIIKSGKFRQINKAFDIWGSDFHPVKGKSIDLACFIETVVNEYKRDVLPKVTSSNINYYIDFGKGQFFERKINKNDFTFEELYSIIRSKDHYGPIELTEMMIGVKEYRSPSGAGIGNELKNILEKPKSVTCVETAEYCLAYAILLGISTKEARDNYLRPKRFEKFSADAMAFAKLYEITSNSEMYAVDLFAKLNPKYRVIIVSTDKTILHATMTYVVPKLTGSAHTFTVGFSDDTEFTYNDNDNAFADDTEITSGTTELSVATVDTAFVDTENSLGTTGITSGTTGNSVVGTSVGYTGIEVTPIYILLFKEHYYYINSINSFMNPKNNHNKWCDRCMVNVPRTAITRHICLKITCRFCHTIFDSDEAYNIHVKRDNLGIEGDELTLTNYTYDIIEMLQEHNPPIPVPSEVDSLLVLGRPRVGPIRCDCGQSLPSYACLLLHKRRYPDCSGKMFYCEHCRTRVNKNKKDHICGERLCRHCNIYVDDQPLSPHRCFIKNLAKTPRGARYYAFDIETTMAPQPDGSLLHEFSLLVVKAVYGDELLKFETLELFAAWVVSVKKKTILFAHNAKAYDSYLLAAYFITNTLTTPSQIIMRGQKILCVTVGMVVLNDSLNHFQGTLSSLPKTFGLSCGSKGYFPYRFYTTANRNYIGVIPSVEYFETNRMNATTLADFEKWYANMRKYGTDDQTMITSIIELATKLGKVLTAEYNAKYDIRKECIKYCVQDCNILGEALKVYRDESMGITGIDPLACITIAGYAMRVYRTSYMPENSIVVPTMREYNFASRAMQGGRTNALRFLHEVTTEQLIAGEHIDYVDVKSLYPTVQMYDQLPCGIPRITEYHFTKDTTSLGTTKDTTSVGTTSDTTSVGTDTNVNASLAATSVVTSDRLNDNAIIHHHYTPTNNIIDSFGNLTPNENDYVNGQTVEWCAVIINNMFGLVECDITPSQMMVPLLLVKKGGKLIESCDKRDFVKCVYTSVELQKALALGYKVTRIYETHEYTPSRDLFAGYVSTFFGIKEANTHNPGRRAIAKLMLNSLWGKFGQNDDMTFTKYFSNPREWFKLVSSEKATKVEIVRTAGEELSNGVIFCKYRDINKSHVKLTNTNMAMAVFTTSQARLRLYAGMEPLGYDRLLYHDTDSIVYISKPDGYNVPFGNALGEWTHENPTPIVKFCALGPKSWSYIRLLNPMPSYLEITTDDINNAAKVEETKCKGFTMPNYFMNKTDSEYKPEINQIQYNAYHTLICDVFAEKDIKPSSERKKLNYKNDLHFERHEGTIKTVSITKCLQFEYDKRVIKSINLTVPHGFIIDGCNEFQFTN